MELTSEQQSKLDHAKQTLAQLAPYENACATQLSYWAEKRRCEQIVAELG